MRAVKDTLCITLIFFLITRPVFSMWNNTLATFNEASSSSTESETARKERECRASNAIQRGSDMWCSKEIKSSQEIVTWTGYLKEERVVKGIRIHWGSSPGKFMIEISANRSLFRPVIGWKDNAKSNEENFTEDIYFPQKYTVAAVRVSMQQPNFRRFGINFIALLPAGEPLVMLTGGMTSPLGELCLQAEQQEFSRGTALVLDECTYAVGMADGRELFVLSDSNQIVHSMSQLCVTLKDNVVDDGGDIVLDDCNVIQNKGESHWEVLYDNRLRVLRQGDYCLSQEGDRAGRADLAIEKMVYTNYPRYMDGDHSAEKAVDGNPETFWLSQEFDYPLGLPDDVEFSVDLGGKYRLIKIEIYWQTPPASYIIFTSTDETKYDQIRKNIGNPFNRTTDPTEGITARYIRIRMIQPHPEYSVSSGKATYGIYQFSVFANRLKSIVGPCEKVVLSNDARDKYFATFVPEFDAYPGQKSIQQEKAFLHMKEELLDGCHAIDNFLENMKSCADKFQRDKQQFLTLHSAIEQMNQLLMDEERKLSHQLNSTGSQELLSSLTSYDGEDCDDIHMNRSTSHSGFYNIKSSCDVNPKRVYCDMESHRTIYFHPLLFPESLLPPNQQVQNGLSTTTSTERKILTPSDVPRICEEVNMKPFVPEKVEDLTLLKNLANHIDRDSISQSPVPGDRLYPIAYFSNLKENNIVGLDTVTDLSQLFKQVRKKFTATDEALALSLTGLELKNVLWSAAQLSGVFCVVSSDLSITNSATNLTCDVVVRNNLLFQSCPYSSLIIRCIESCKKKLYNRSDGLTFNVYGTTIYRDDSSVCAAAEHAGALGKHGLVNVTLLPGFAVYEGSLAHGILSQSYSGVPWDRSFQVSQPGDRCHNQKNQQDHQISFVQIRDHNEMEMGNLEQTNKKLFTTSDMMTSNVVQKLLSNGQIQTTDSMAQHLADIANEKVALFRSILKPTEELNTELTKIVTHLEKDVSLLLDHVYKLEGRAINSLDSLSRKKVELNSDKEILQNGCSSFYIGNFITYLLNGLDQDFISQFYPLVFTKEVIPSFSELIHSTEMFDGTWSITSIENTDTPILDGKESGPRRSVEYALQYMPKSLSKSNSMESLETISEKSETKSLTDYESFLGFGPPIYVKNKRIYDGQLSLSYMIPEGDGSFCIAFRIKNPRNMYIFEINQKNGFKRMMRVIDGEPVILAKNQDGGYLNSVWYTVTIMLSRDTLTISTGRRNTELQTLFHLSDASHLSGTVGVFAQDAQCLIRDIKFVASPCYKSDVPPAPPYPLQCSLFNYSYVENFHYQWHVVDPPQSLTSGLWVMKKQVSGRKNVIVQYNSVYGTEEQLGTLAILKRHRFCRDGVFSFDFFPQCDGIIGAVFHYTGPYQWTIVEIGRYFVRVRYISLSKEKSSGWEFHDVAQVETTTYSEARFQPEQWNTVIVDFFSNTIGIHLNGQPIFQTNLPETTVIPPDGRVGLSAWNCGGVAFDRIQLRPRTFFINSTDHLFLQRNVNTDFVTGTLNSSLIQRSVSANNFETLCSPTVSCLASHISDRRDECRVIRDISPSYVVTEKWDFNSFKWIDASLFPCQYNYCAECCTKNIQTCLNSMQKRSGGKNLERQSVLLDKLHRIKLRCLQECSKRNSEAQKSAEALSERLSYCTQPYTKTFKKSLTSENFIRTSCNSCCDKDNDKKIGQECRRYCSPQRRFWETSGKSVDFTRQRDELIY